MKLTINSSELTKALEQAAKIVSAKPLMPILANLKLVATEERLEITGFNLAHGIEVKLVDVEVIRSGGVCIPVSAIAIIKGMAGQLIIEADDNSLITISNLSGSCEIQCQESSEYPDIVPDDIDKTIQCEIDIKTFAQAIKLGGSCVSDEPTKMILQGVNIVAENGLLTLASTNGHKLVVYKTTIDESIKIPSSTIPTKLLGTIEGSGIMTLTISDTDCMVDTGDTIITCRSFTGKYPDYPMLLPKSFSRDAILDRTQLIDSLNLMSAIGNENSLVKLVFESDRLTISSEKEGAKGTRKIDCELTGEELTIALNLKYVLGQLKTIPSQLIKISMNDALMPLTIQPVDSNLDLLCLLMPVQLRS